MFSASQKSLEITIGPQNPSKVETHCVLQSLRGKVEFPVQVEMPQVAIDPYWTALIMACRR